MWNLWTEISLWSWTRCRVTRMADFLSPPTVSTRVAVSAASQWPFNKNLLASLIVDLSCRVSMPEIYFNFTFQLSMFIRFTSSEINVIYLWFVYTTKDIPKYLIIWSFDHSIIQSFIHSFIIHSYPRNLWMLRIPRLSRAMRPALKPLI